MPTGRFEAIHKSYFNAIDGAYTTMTAEEVRKATFNVKSVIRKMAIDNKLPQATDRSIETCSFKISDRVTGFSTTAVTLTFKLAKPEPKNEMTIYFTSSLSIPRDKLAPGNIWFICFKENDPTPWLGIMTPAEWAGVTGATPVASATAATTHPTAAGPCAPTVTKRKISKRTLSRSDMQAEKNLDLELLDEIADSDIPAEATFEYSGTPKQKPEPLTAGSRKIYRRNKQIALRALAKAGHNCEASDIPHPSFLRKRKAVLYMEPHHLIPLEYQDDFEFSLDIEENIVSLCSNCHNRFHYGWGFDKLLERLYNGRIEHLRCAGIEISLEELLEIYS